MNQPTSNAIWLKNQLHHLDNPECLIHEMNSVVRDWEDFPTAIKVCLTVPVPYSAMIANLGFAILYDILNREVKDVICERFYFPEAKLLRRLKKASKLLFSKETCHDLKEFDIIGFSSYFPLQMLGVPEILELAGLKALTKDRGDDVPLVVFGGVTAFNADPIYNLVDIIFIGEGEESVKPLVDAVRKYKGQLNWKFLVKKELCNQPGFYVPEFYSEDYYPKDHSQFPNQFKCKTPLFDFVPARVVKATIDMKKIPPLTRMLVSNSEGEEMSCGSLMLAIGCSNRCFFCNGSFTTAPYRERDLSVVKSCFSDLILNTGAYSITPYSFNLSDFSNINELIRWLMMDENRKVSMSSQRIDYFSENFARKAHESGNRSITLAIEAGSERMRRIINKNLTEDDILKTFGLAFKVGFTNIKIYMIANLPFETDTDRLAIVPLIGKIAALKEKYGTKTKIRVSYTPFQAKNHTPFQWAPTLAVDKQTGLPIFEKNLGPVIEGVHAFNVKFRVGTNSDLSVINQCLTLGDRRMASVVYDFYKSSFFAYRGGMSVGMHPLIPFQNVLRKYGLDYNDFLREKGEDEAFPWDFIDAGITKEFLLKAWRLAKHQNLKLEDGTLPISSENPFDAFFKSDLTAAGKRKGGGVPPCWTKCTGCGCCLKGSKVRHINMPDHSQDLKVITDSSLEKRYFQYLMLLQFYVYRDQRFVHGSKIKMYLRRAALRAGLPILNEFSLASDEVITQNWMEGIDYAECLCTGKPNLSEAQIVEALNKELWNMEVVSIQFVPSEKKVLRNSFDLVYYQVQLPKHKSILFSANRAVAAFNEKKSFIVEIKVNGPTRDSFEIIKHDIKQDRVGNIWLTEGVQFDILHLHLASIISPYDFMAPLFDTTKRDVLEFAARRVDYFQHIGAGEQDMFSVVCEVCGAEIEKDLFDLPISPSHCLRHADLFISNIANLIPIREAKVLVPF